jgi:16S rRNA (guanine527-N7)-methyltransferase
MELIKKYFPKLSEKQLEQFAALDELYRDWNSKINLISRKDIDNLYERHILHSLAIAKFTSFRPGAEILDVGTGGGFPGIPLAIFFPEVKFHMIDGTKKKIMVVQDVIEKLGLQNATAQQVRAEELKGREFDYVVTRAVAVLPTLLQWCQKLFKKEGRHAIPNGLLSLKGGNVKNEIKSLPKGEYAEAYPISKFFKEEFFEGKYVVYLQG